MLNTLPYLPHAHLPGFLSTLTPLATTNPSLFAPHLSALLKFLPGLILPSADAGPTPTVSRPNPNGSPSFAFPPPSAEPDSKGKSAATDDDDDEETNEVRKAALEFMVSLSEAKPSMVRRVDGWTAAVVRGCLEGMGELAEEDMEVWLEADVRPLTRILSVAHEASSPQKTLRTTTIRMRTNRHWTGPPLRSAANQCCHPHFSIYPACWSTMIGDCAMQASWLLLQLRREQTRSCSTSWARSWSAFLTLQYRRLSALTQGVVLVDW